MLLTNYAPKFVHKSPAFRGGSDTEEVENRNTPEEILEKQKEIDATVGKLVLESYKIGECLKEIKENFGIKEKEATSEQETYKPENKFKSLIFQLGGHLEYSRFPGFIHTHEKRHGATENFKNDIYRLTDHILKDPENSIYFESDEQKKESSKYLKDLVNELENAQKQNNDKDKRMFKNVIASVGIYILNALDPHVNKNAEHKISLSSIKKVAKESDHKMKAWDDFYVTLAKAGYIGTSITAGAAATLGGASFPAGFYVTGAMLAATPHMVKVLNSPRRGYM